MEIDHLKEYIYQDCQRQIEAGKHYLVIQDTTQPNFERNRGNIAQSEGLGVIGDGRSIGFFLHPSLVIEAEEGRCVGFSDLQTWSREEGGANKKERKYKALPIEEKESMRWLTAHQNSQERLREAGRLTTIADREGDISELFDRRGRGELLIRSRDNRSLRAGKLYEHLAWQEKSGSFKLEIKGDFRQNRARRRALIEVRFSEVELSPKKLGGQTIKVFALEAREQHPPAGEKPILWRLLTTHEVRSYEQACQIIKWYALRWNIEQVFRMIKQKGLAVEASEVESGKGLILLTLMALFTASKVILLHLSSKAEKPQPIKQTFTKEERECLEVICQKYEGNTWRQKNNYPRDSLQWCYWVIARLGGWKPQEKQAGVITLFRGWNEFKKIYEGWELALQFVS
jgi:hypothetical protein